MTSKDVYWKGSTESQKTGKRKNCPLFMYHKCDGEELRSSIGRRVSNDNQINKRGSGEKVVVLNETYNRNSVMDYACIDRKGQERVRKV